MAEAANSCLEIEIEYEIRRFLITQCEGRLRDCFANWVIEEITNMLCVLHDEQPRNVIETIFLRIRKKFAREILTDK